jgi:hypothetical protein
MKPQRVDHETKTLSRRQGDATSVTLILVIAHLLLANLYFRLPEVVQLTAEQIASLPLWGP